MRNFCTPYLGYGSFSGPWSLSRSYSGEIHGVAQDTRNVAGDNVGDSVSPRAPFVVLAATPKEEFK